MLKEINSDCQEGEIMTKVYFIFVLIFVLVCNGAMSQGVGEIYNPGKAINSQYDELNPILTPDGKILFFSRVNHPNNTFGTNDSQDIWFSTFINGKWSTANRLNSFINSGRYNAIFGVYNDGKKFLINNWFDNKNRPYASGLSIVEFNGKSFTNVKKLKIPGFESISKGSLLDAHINNDGNVIVLAGTTKNEGENLNLYITTLKKNGTWSKLRSLKSLNTNKASEEAPFIDAKERALYFTRYSRSKSEIFKSVALDSSWINWSVPEVVTITQASGFNSFYKLSADNAKVVMVTNNKSIGGTDIVFIKIFEPNPFILLEGNLFVGSEKRKISKEKPLSMLVNGAVSDSLKINYDSSNYRAILPLGKKYVINPLMDNHVVVPYEGDFTERKEFLKISHDFNFNAIPYVSVQGNLVEKTTGTPISQLYNPVIYIDDQPVDSIMVDTTGLFSFKIPFGKNYKISFEAFAVEAGFDSLLLKNVDEYKEIKIQLYGNKDNTGNFLALKNGKLSFYTISGLVLDKTTGKKPETGYEIQINQKTYPADIDLEKGTFNLKLPPAKKYMINAIAAGYYPVYETTGLGQPEVKKAKGVKVIQKPAGKEFVKVLNLNLVPLKSGQSISLKNIFFETGKAKLKPSSYAELDRLVSFLRSNQNINITIDGHSDDQGNKEKNAHLSWLRAKAVYEYLLNNEVGFRQITFNGYGTTKPIASNKTPEGRALNRRVEFTILEVK